MIFKQRSKVPPANQFTKTLIFVFYWFWFLICFVMLAWDWVFGLILYNFWFWSELIFSLFYLYFWNTCCDQLDFLIYLYFWNSLVCDRKYIWFLFSALNVAGEINKLRQKKLRWLEKMEVDVGGVRGRWARPRVGEGQWDCAIMLLFYLILLLLLRFLLVF